MQAPALSKLGRKYGYRPSGANHPLLKLARHLHLQAPWSGAAVDWRKLLTPVRDQGQEGSCFAHSTAALKEFNCSIWAGGAAPLGGWLSVAYLSWRTRLAMGTFPEDSGASLADVMAVLQAWGVCPETWLAYNQNPSEAGNAGCDVAAHPYRVREPVVVPIDPDIWRAALEQKRVINIGFQVAASFEDTGPDGVVPPPAGGILGGHAVLVVGWGPSGFIIRNSWGTSWGDGGYCYFPDAYLSNVFEAWTTA